MLETSLDLHELSCTQQPCNRNDQNMVEVTLTFLVNWHQLWHTQLATVTERDSADAQMPLEESRMWDLVNAVPNFVIPAWNLLAWSDRPRLACNYLIPRAH